MIETLRAVPDLLPQAVVALDFAAVFVFALTGALSASRAQLDIVGFFVLSGLTAVGGGTLRDLLLNRDPVFWIGRPEYLAVIALAAAVIYFTAHLVESRYRWLEWLNAAALSVAVAAGVGVALAAGQPWVIVAVMGVVTGTVGGLLRDVVATEVPLLLKQGELYATAALAGAAAGLLALAFGAAPVTALPLIAAVTFTLRAGSLWFGWRLPVYRARPPRN
ncbi:trimeric intracellular cation channel family protein [Oceaniglobus indicus]|uniref:trimeric intracellular cation channel family protein n=1 Tax=Oceaniglobus indicus TaxID=2047749 RepID=UPI000C19803D|nr:trimeric intracellular cation channel family protein [Oceaniglobus indicus]